MRRRQDGVTTVEFAVAGSVALLVLFACIEIARMLYVWNTIAESTRRGARLAAVCPVNDPLVTQAVLFDSTGSATSSRFVPGLTAANVNVSYLDDAGAATGVFNQIRYVRVGITGYQHELMIPFVGGNVAAPPFETTLPAESLGFVPETGANECLMG